MPVHSFIYDDQFRIIATNDGWDKTIQRALHMLVGLRHHENKKRIAQLKYCLLYSSAPWENSMATPEGLKTWFERKWTTHDQPRGWPIAGLNPHNLSIKDIPVGQYCYRLKGNMKYKADGAPYWSAKYCPYMGNRKFNGVPVTWCKFLRLGSVPNGTTEEQYTKLREHFGSEEKQDKVLPLFLLWDSCKECAVKFRDDE